MIRPYPMSQVLAHVEVGWSFYTTNRCNIGIQQKDSSQRSIIMQGGGSNQTHIYNQSYLSIELRIIKILCSNCCILLYIGAWVNRLYLNYKVIDKQSVKIDNSVVGATFFYPFTNLALSVVKTTSSSSRVAAIFTKRYSQLRTRATGNPASIHFCRAV